MGNLLKRLATEIAEYMKPPIILIDDRVLRRLFHGRPVTHIQVSIPLQNITLFRNQLNLTCMANQFGKAFKVPYKLTGAAGDDGVINNPVFSGAASTQVKPDDSSGMTGFILGVTDGVDNLVVNGTNSAGAPITGSVTVTVSDAPPPPPPLVPVATIGIELGDPVAQ